MIPGPFTSSGEKMFITFESTTFSQSDRFRAHYETFHLENGEPCPTSSNEELIGTEGTFGCNGYGNEIIKTFHITSPPSEHITIRFPQFNIEDFGDILQIY